MSSLKKKGQASFTSKLLCSKCFNHINGKENLRKLMYEMMKAFLLDIPNKATHR